MLVNHLRRPEDPRNRILDVLAQMLRVEMKKLGKLHRSPGRWGYVGEVSYHPLSDGTLLHPDEGTFLEDLTTDCYSKIFLVKPADQGEEAKRIARGQRAVRWKQLLDMADIQGSNCLYFYVRRAIRNYLFDKEAGADRPAHNLFQHLRKSIHWLGDQGVLFRKSRGTITNRTQVWFAASARPDDVRLPRPVSFERLRQGLEGWHGWDERFKQMQIDPNKDIFVRDASYVLDMMDTLRYGGIDSFLVGELAEALKQVGRERNLMPLLTEIRRDEFLEKHPDTAANPPEELVDLEQLKHLRRQIDQLPGRVQAAIDSSDFQQRKKETLHRIASAFFEVFRQTESAPSQIDLANHLRESRQWVNNRWSEFMELLRTAFGEDHHRSSESG